MISRYIVEQGGDLDGFVILELEATLSGDLDLDADRGAVLVIPERILAREPVDRKLAGSFDERRGKG
jgi:hypothetical protein